MISEEELLAVQKRLRSRFDDFRRALERRDEAAYRLALTDFHEQLRRWTAAEERVLLPVLARAYFEGRDPQRELRLLFQIDEHAPIADVLGLVENLERRLKAHDSEMENVYYPSAAPLLTSEEWRLLTEAAPPD